jgi:nicotinate-nucleotide adenylyltransferase
MGSDSYQNIDEWKNAETLQRNYFIYVYERPGFPVTPPVNSNVVLKKAPLLQISATHIRELIQQQKSIRFLVPDVVKEEIDQNNYYKLKDPS